MTTFKIPNSQGQIRTNYQSDKYGELWETFGVSLKNEGKIQTTRKLLKTKDVNDDTNFGDVVGLATFGSRHYAFTASGSGKEIYRCSVLEDPTVEANWIKYNSNGQFSDETDTAVFGGLLLASTATDIFSTTGSADTTNWWTSTVSGTALTTGKPHVLKVLRGGQETLFVTDGNKVRYYNSTAGHSVVTLQSDLTASTMDRGRDSMWVGTHTESNENALVYEIYVGEQLDGTPVARYAFEVEGRAVLWLKVVDGVPYVLTDKGHIQMFNGAGFQTVRSLPFAFTNETLDGVRAGGVDDNPLNRPVHHAGADVDNQSVFFLMNTKEYGVDSVPTRCFSGVWEFDTQTRQLNHRASLVETTAQNGSPLLTESGPLMVINNSETMYLAGGEINGQDNGLFTETESRYGFITTTEIDSGTVQDAFEAQYIKAKTLTGDDSIQLKYRISKRDREVLSGAWASETQFNTEDTTQVAVGDEITILSGTNNGYSAHVTEINTSDTTTQITVDTAIGTTDEASIVETTNFLKYNETYTSSDGEFKKYGVAETNTWAQYKLILDGDVELREFISKGTAKTEQ